MSEQCKGVLDCDIKLPEAMRIGKEKKRAIHQSADRPQKQQSRDPEKHS